MTAEPKVFPKRFITFRYETYYPGGGMEDATGSYDTLEEALAADAGYGGVDHVLDRETGEVIEPPSGGPGTMTMVAFLAARGR